MEATQISIDVWNMIVSEMSNIFATGTVNIFVIIMITFITQMIKMSVYFFSKRMLLLQVLIAIMATAFYYLVLGLEITMIPVLFSCYLCIPVFFYLAFKKSKTLSKYFKSNYHFLKEKELERKAKKNTKRSEK